jgi:hypothetical protein
MRAAIVIFAGIAILSGGAVNAAPSPAKPAVRAATRPAPRHPPRKPLMEQAHGRGLVTAVISEHESVAARVPEL